jgi:hypothetical protein
MTLRICVLLGVLLVAPCAASLAQTTGDILRVTELRCEYLADPLGIDVLQPRLGWQIQSADPTGEGIFCHRFNHAVSRWITIRGLSTAPRVEDVRDIL